MKLDIDMVLESAGPFMVLTIDKYNGLKGELGNLKGRLKQLEESNEFLRKHIRKLEDYIDETTGNS